MSPNVLLTYCARKCTIAVKLVKIVRELDRESCTPAAVRHRDVEITIGLGLCVIQGGGMDDDIACSGAAAIEAGDFDANIFTE